MKPLAPLPRPALQAREWAGVTLRSLKVKP